MLQQTETVFLLNKRFVLFSRNPFPALSNIDTLRKEKYEAFLIKTMSSATLLKSLEKCDTINTNMHNLIQNQNTYEIEFSRILKLRFSFSSDTFKYIYEQESTNDVTSLLPILPCFGLFSLEPLGLYHGVLRFTSNKYNFYLIGSKSPLYTSIAIAA